MAKNSAVLKNERRKAKVAKYADKRAKLKAIVMNKELPLNERMEAQFKLAELPRNSAENRLRRELPLHLGVRVNHHPVAPLDAG